MAASRKVNDLVHPSVRAFVSINRQTEPLPTGPTKTPSTRMRSRITRPGKQLSRGINKETEAERGRLDVRVPAAFNDVLQILGDGLLVLDGTTKLADAGLASFKQRLTEKLDENRDALRELGFSPSEMTWLAQCAAPQGNEKPLPNSREAVHGVGLSIILLARTSLGLPFTRRAVSKSGVSSGDSACSFAAKAMQEMGYQIDVETVQKEIYREAFKPGGKLAKVHEQVLNAVPWLGDYRALPQPEKKS